MTHFITFSSRHELCSTFKVNAVHSELDIVDIGGWGRWDSGKLHRHPMASEIVVQSIARTVGQMCLNLLFFCSRSVLSVLDLIKEKHCSTKYLIFNKLPFCTEICLKIKKLCWHRIEYSKCFYLILVDLTFNIQF